MVGAVLCLPVLPYVAQCCPRLPCIGQRPSQDSVLQAGSGDGLVHNIHACKTLGSILKNNPSFIYFKKNNSSFIYYDKKNYFVDDFTPKYPQESRYT